MDHIDYMTQPTPLWLHFEHIGRTYRIIGWQRNDNGFWCPIILSQHGEHRGLGIALQSVGAGTWPIHYTDTPPDNPGDI